MFESIPAPRSERRPTRVLAPEKVELSEQQITPDAIRKQILEVGLPELEATRANVMNLVTLMENAFPANENADLDNGAAGTTFSIHVMLNRWRWEIENLDKEEKELRQMLQDLDENYAEG